jgi:hypothetical protein
MAQAIAFGHGQELPTGKEMILDSAYTKWKP